MGRARRARQVRPGGRHADHRRIHLGHPAGIQRDQCRHRRDPDRPVRPRIDHARRVRRQAAARSPTGSTARSCRCTSTRIRCMSAGGRRRSAAASAAAAAPEIPGVGMNVTPMAGPSQQRITPYDPDRRRRLPPARPAAGRAAAGRRRPWPAGGGGGGGRGGFPGAGAAATEAPRVILRFPSNPGRDAAVGDAGRRAGAREPRPARRYPARPGPRRVVRHPAVLALADAGQLFPGVQRHPELERSGRRPGRVAARRTTTAGQDR